MKYLKGAGGIFFCVLLSAGILLSVIQDIADRVVSDTIADVVVDRMVSASLHRVLPDALADNALLSQFSEELSDPLREQIKDQLHALKSEMMVSEYLQNMSGETIDAMLGTLIEEKAVLPDVNDDMRHLARAFAPQLSQTLGITITEEQMTQITDAIAKQMDVNGLFEELTARIGWKLTPTQKDILRLLRFLNNGSLLWLAKAIIIIACVGLLINKRSLLLWFSHVGVTAMICGIVFMGCGKIIVLLRHKTSNAPIELLSSVGSEMMDLLFWEGISIFTIGIVAVLMYGAGNAIKQRNVSRRG